MNPSPAYSEWAAVDVALEKLNVASRGSDGRLLSRAERIALVLERMQEMAKPKVRGVYYGDIKELPNAGGCEIVDERHLYKERGQKVAIGPCKFDFLPGVF